MSETTAPKSNQGIVKTARLSVPLPQPTAKELLEAKGKVSVSSPTGSEIATQGKAEASSGSTSASTPKEEAPFAIIESEKPPIVKFAGITTRSVDSLPSRSVESLSSSQVSTVSHGASSAVAAAGKASSPSSATAGSPTPSTKATAPAAATNSTVVTRPAVPKVARPMASLADRVASIMEIDAGTPPIGLIGGTTDDLSSGYFHLMIYGEPNTYKTTVAGEYGGPIHSFFIVTRRSEQLIPLARKGFKFVVAENADALRWALLHPEAAAKHAASQIGKPDSAERAAAIAWAESWANDLDRVIIVDDTSEGTNVLKEDYMYVYNEKTGETTKIKDGRQAYKKAGDELHDLLKITLGRPQHVILIAVDTNFDVEGTVDNRTEPDLPNKMRKLFETELEYVFFFPHGDKMQTKTSKVVRSAQLEGKKEPVIWNEIVFAKCKLPMEYLGKGVVGNMEDKNLRKVWTAIQAAVRGDWKPADNRTPTPSSLSAGVASSPKPVSSASTTAKPPLVRAGSASLAAKK